jgi:hypothetical protein
MPPVAPADTTPQYAAGTDGRMTIGAADPDTGALDGTRVVVGEIRKWSLIISITRPSTVTAESPANAITGVVHKTHLRRGGISEKKLSGECLIKLNTGKVTPNIIFEGAEFNCALLFDKATTLGHHGVLITILSCSYTGLDVEGQPVYSFEAEINGVLPAVSAGA